MTDTLQTGFVHSYSCQWLMQSKKLFYALSSSALLQNSVSATVRSAPATLHRPLFLRFRNASRYHKEPFHIQRIGNHILHSVIISFNMIWIQAYLCITTSHCIVDCVFQVDCSFMIGRCQSSIVQMESDSSVACVVDMHVH